jgi:hypothetical protein
MDGSSSRPESTIVKEVVVVEKRVGLVGAAIELARRIRRR